jgi:hypothetical protein
MKERPILFSTPMVHALLDDNKTETRRIINPQPWYGSQVPGGPHFIYPPGSGQRFNATSSSELNIFNNDGQAFYLFTDYDQQQISKHCKFGRPGDILWVRENFNVEYEPIPYEGTETKQVFFYKATERVYADMKWKPSIHMPKEACRIWLKIKNTKAERLQQMTEADCIAEGIKKVEPTILAGYTYNGITFYETAKEAFRALWIEINGKPSANKVKVNGKTITTGYVLYAYDKEHAKQFGNCDYRDTYKGKQLTIIVNPWLWVVQFEVLSTTGKPSNIEQRSTAIV